MPDKGKDAYDKGKDDGERARTEDDIGKLLNPIYSPPSEHKEEYNAGFKDGKEGK